MMAHDILLSMILTPHFADESAHENPKALLLKAHILGASSYFVNGLHPQSYTVLYQWEFQDPKMEVLYHIRPYFAGIFSYIGLT